MKKKHTNTRTLVAYVTKSGVTRENASVIASVLRDRYGLKVDVVDLKKTLSPNLTKYKNVIVGSGVRVQRVYKRAWKFLEKNDFEGKKVVLFLSSLEAGEPENYDDAVKKYIQNILAKYLPVKPFAAEAFGGKMKILGFTIKDNRNVEKVKAWAEELGKKLGK